MLQSSFIPILDENNLPIKIILDDSEIPVRHLNSIQKDVINNSYSGHLVAPDNKIYYLEYSFKNGILSVDTTLCLTEMPNNITPPTDRIPEFTLALQIFYNSFQKIDEANDKFRNQSDTKKYLLTGFNAKILKHINTVYIILTNEDTNLEFLDTDTVNILIRTIYECVVTFKYLFGEENSIEQEEFRMIIWEYASKLKTWEKHRKVITPIYRGDTLKRIMKTWKEKALYEMENNPIFIGLKESEKRQLRNGRWRLKTSFIKLGEWLGLRKEYLESMYQKLSSSVHSDYDSIANSYVSPQALDYSLHEFIYSLNFLIVVLLKYYEILRSYYKLNIDYFYQDVFVNDIDKDEFFNEFLKECQKVEVEERKN